MNFYREFFEFFCAWYKKAFKKTIALPSKEERSKVTTCKVKSGKELKKFMNKVFERDVKIKVKNTKNTVFRLKGDFI